MRAGKLGLLVLAAGVWAQAGTAQAQVFQSDAAMTPLPQPVVWTEAERKKGQAWGLKTIETFHTHGTPPIDQYTGPIKK